ISNADIKRDDYVVVILKQHRTEMWKLFGISVPLLAASSSDCQLTFVPTVRLAGNWESEVGQTAIIRAGSIGTPIVTIVGGENGVDIRPVRDDERAWIEDLVAKILAAQAAATPGAEPLEKAGEPK
ncbi:MAG: hypothetical protein KDJ16_17445, partial [Hyphomicrobiales bacterium]|nr:hypothetical protein [Hyphomicrobiales bacterium]